MGSFRQTLLDDPLRLVIPVGVLLATLAAGFLVRSLLFRALRRWAGGAEGRVDRVLTKSLSGPILIWSLILGIYFATESLVLPTRAENLIDRTLVFLVILSVTLMTARLTGNLIRFYGN